MEDPRLDEPKGGETGVSEPSVLDYLKGWLMPWKYARVELPDEDMDPSEEARTGASTPINQAVDEQQAATADEPIEEAIQVPDSNLEPPQADAEVETARQKHPLPWAATAALLLALIAQNSLEPGPGRSWLPGAAFYLLAFTALGFAIYRQEWRLAHFPISERQSETLDVRLPELISGLVFAALTYITSGGNRFTIFNVTILTVSTILMMRAFWVPQQSIKSWFQQVVSYLSMKKWTLTITPESLLLAGAVILVLAVRFTGLDKTPAEMNSDHAEKILDVMRVLSGQTMIFFPTNGGREPLQMYLMAGLNRFLGLSVDFFALKLASSLVGALSLVYIFKLGKLVANARVGLIAFSFAGVAYWTIVVSHMGLRLPFYFLFTAATLFFLIRGLMKQQRNDFLLAGLSLGLSFYGYTADRILPLLVVMIIGIFLLHKDSAGYRRSTITASVGLILVALVLFIPLFRYMMDYPGAFLFRSLSRIGPIEQPLQAPALVIFLNNLWKAMVMFSWSNGEVWTLSIPYRPALDIVSGALYWTGFGLVLVRAVRKRHWIDISLLLSIPVLLLPSVLSLAFPSENPNLYRTGGAAIPVFLLVALSLDGFMSSWEKRLEGRSGKIIAWGVAILLLIGSTFQSYELVFREYHDQYELSAWNTSEMGEVIKSFSETIGTSDTAWVVGYPYWVDTRIAAMQAGQLLGDVNITIDQLGNTLNDPRAKLFLVKPEDLLAVVTLNNMYPQGTFSSFASRVPSKEFLIFLVPPGEQ